ncbi:MAG: hypothetical protein AAFP81_11815 [Pseudomonadota bacterium]
MAHHISEQVRFDIGEESHADVNYTLIALCLGAFSGGTMVGLIWLTTSIFF